MRLCVVTDYPCANGCPSGDVLRMHSVTTPCARIVATHVVSLRVYQTDKAITMHFQFNFRSFSASPKPKI